MKEQRKILSIISKDNSLTEFQKSVYRVLLRIPSGSVRSYKWVAGAIGRPKAFRAVGNALNKNPYPVIVPCHRVIRLNGSLGGFASGLKAKKSLLEKEGVDCANIRCYNC